MKCSVLMMVLCTALTMSATQAFAKKKVEVMDEKVSKQLIEDYSKHLFETYKNLKAKNMALKEAIELFVKDPNPGSHFRAKEAWIEARLAYSPTEAFRFYGGPIDDAEKGPEGLMNAWPLDEGYIDYVQGNAEAGIINNPKLYPQITKDLLISMNEKDGERNISTGYHAIEFLLWGQDQSLSHAGGRTFEDYVVKKAPNAERRALYLKLLAELLVDHTEKVLNEWSPEQKGNYAEQFKKLPVNDSIQKILLGMATLSVDEMSGERMTVPFEKFDQENEQNCFSDTTHADLVANQKGILALYSGNYTGFKGVGVEQLFANKNPKLAEKISKHMNSTLKHLETIEAPIDVLIMAKKKSPAKKHVFKTIDELQTQATLLAKGAAVFGLDVNVAAE
jgi:putative iron-regulated protein